MRLAPLLRLLASIGQYGHSRTPRNFYIRPDEYCSYHWSHAKSAGIYDFETWNKVARLSVRYRRFVEYVREVEPRWAEIDRIHYADNSIDVVQRAYNGRTRMVTVNAPSGDVCF